jgi:hypothetical protein
MQLGSLLPRLQELENGTYSEPAESNSIPSILRISDPF